MKPSHRIDAEQKSDEGCDQTEFEEQEDDEQALSHQHPREGKEEVGQPIHLAEVQFEDT